MQPRVVFDYHIVKTDTNEFMPQRGVSGWLDGFSTVVYWRDAVPVPAPTIELAKAYLDSIKKFDTSCTPGAVVEGVS